MTSELDGYMATAELARAANKTSEKTTKINNIEPYSTRSAVCERASDAGTTYSTAGSCQSAFYSYNGKSKIGGNREQRNNILDARSGSQGTNGRLCRSAARSEEDRTLYGTR